MIRDRITVILIFAAIIAGIAMCSPDEAISATIDCVSLT